MASPFEFDDYKAYLRQLTYGEWGSVSRLADAAGCQRSYLSRVLGNPEAQLTPDQAFGIVEHLALPESESEYVLTMVELERAGSPRYRQKLEAKLARLRQEYDDLQKRVQRPAAAMSQKEFAYYSNWMYAALHILVSIPEFQTSAAIARRLHMPGELVDEVLAQLRDWSLVKHEDRRWKFGGAEIHVTKDSPLSVLHHANWRQRATLDAQKRSPKSIHYTVVQSLDRAAWERIRAELLKLIEEASRIAGPAKEEMLICFAADLFEV